VTTTSEWTPALRAACIERSGKLYAFCYSEKRAPCDQCRAALNLTTGSN